MKGTGNGGPVDVGDRPGRGSASPVGWIKSHKTGASIAAAAAGLGVVMLIKRNSSGSSSATPASSSTDTTGTTATPSAYDSGSGYGYGGDPMYTDYGQEMQQLQNFLGAWQAQQAATSGASPSPTPGGTTTTAAPPSTSTTGVLRGAPILGRPTWTAPGKSVPSPTGGAKPKAPAKGKASTPKTPDAHQLHLAHLAHLRSIGKG